MVVVKAEILVELMIAQRIELKVLMIAAEEVGTVAVMEVVFVGL